MTDAQERHLARILKDFAARASGKYRKGAEEHGGNLFDLTPLQLIDNAVDEAVDQVVYLLTLRSKICDAKAD